MNEVAKEVEVVYLTVAMDGYSKKWWQLNYHFSEEDALRYLEIAPKAYPEFKRFFVVRYVRCGDFVAEITR